MEFEWTMEKGKLITEFQKISITGMAEGTLLGLLKYPETKSTHPCEDDFIKFVCKCWKARNFKALVFEAHKG